jgi:hypothetical protein
MPRHEEPPEGLFRRDERTPEVRQLFADAILASAKEMAHSVLGVRCRKVEVYARSQSEDDPYAAWEHGEDETTAA